jgi:hypothetical protein
VEDALTRTAGGAGIGLSLVKKFMQAMGEASRPPTALALGCTITLAFPIFDAIRSLKLKWYPQVGWSCGNSLYL